MLTWIKPHTSVGKRERENKQYLFFHLSWGASKGNVLYRERERVSVCVSLRLSLLFVWLDFRFIQITEGGRESSSESGVSLLNYAICFSASQGAGVSERTGTRSWRSQSDSMPSGPNGRESSAGRRVGHPTSQKVRRSPGERRWLWCFHPSSRGKIIPTLLLFTQYYEQFQSTQSSQTLNESKAQFFLVSKKNTFTFVWFLTLLTFIRHMRRFSGWLICSSAVSY